MFRSRTSFSSCFMRQAEKESQTSNKSISEKLAKVYSEIPENEQTATCNATLESWRELTKNDSW